MKFFKRTRRIVRRFALFPKRLHRGVVWLEWYYIRQFYDEGLNRWRNYSEIMNDRWYSNKKEWLQSKIDGHFYFEGDTRFY